MREVIPSLKWQWVRDARVAASHSVSVSMHCKWGRWVGCLRQISERALARRGARSALGGGGNYRHLDFPPSQSGKQVCITKLVCSLCDFRHFRRRIISPGKSPARGVLLDAPWASRSFCPYSYPVGRYVLHGSLLGWALSRASPRSSSGIAPGALCPVA